jgi:hypothetical protein
MTAAVKRLSPLLLILLAGCSTAPIAGTLDLIRPSRATPSEPRPERGPDRGPDRIPPPGDDFLVPPRLDR